MEVAAAVDILLSIIDHAAQWSAVIQKARSEGRSLTEAEVDGFVAQAAASETNLQAAIDKARAGG
jgi:hypothetical protein